MAKYSPSVLLAFGLIAALFITGCVERQLTINTVPAGALVTLNDEEIGLSPVTVNFEWYGDFNVRISKAGYETLKTHQALRGPWYDLFPFDLFAQLLNPDRIVDKYEWQFKLEPKKIPSRDQLITEAQNLKNQL